MPSLLKKQERIEFFHKKYVIPTGMRCVDVNDDDENQCVTQCTRCWNFAQGVPNSWTRAKVNLFPFIAFYV